MRNEPEGFVQISLKFLERGHQYCFVKLATTRKREGFVAGDYALIDLTVKPSAGDMVLTASEAGLRIYRLEHKDGILRNSGGR